MQSRIVVDNIEGAGYPTIVVGFTDFGVIKPPVGFVEMVTPSGDTVPLLQYKAHEFTTAYKIKETLTPTWHNTVCLTVAKSIRNYVTYNIGNNTNKRESLRILLGLLPVWIREFFPSKDFEIVINEIPTDSVDFPTDLVDSANEYSFEHSSNYISIVIEDCAVITVAKFTNIDSTSAFGSILKSNQSNFSRDMYEKWVTLASEAGVLESCLSYDNIKAIMGNVLQSK